MIFDSDSDQKILNPPWSDEYLKSTKAEGDDMSNLRVKVKEIILDSIEYGRTHLFYHTRKLQLSEEEIVHKGIFVDDKTDQIIEFIEQEVLQLIEEKLRNCGGWNLSVCQVMEELKR